MPQIPYHQIARRLAQRHEALFAKLQPLIRQVDILARQRPDSIAPAPLRGAIQALLFDIRPFRDRQARARPPEPAPDNAGLARQLSDAQGVLLAFESRHTQWNAAVGDTMWMVPGTMMKVRRLMPRPGSKAAARAEAKARQDDDLRAARIVELRDKLVRRLEQYRRREPAPSADR